ncbi:hypothetical protein M3J09_010759 [Ascochyta lentis]
MLPMCWNNQWRSIAMTGFLHNHIHPAEYAADDEVQIISHPRDPFHDPAFAARNNTSMVFCDTRRGHQETLPTRAPHIATLLPPSRPPHNS